METMLVVAPTVEPMGRAIESPRGLPSGGVRPEVLEQRPAPQPQLRRASMPMQAPAGVHQPAEPVHRPVPRVARPMAARMVIGHRTSLRPGPQLLQHLANRGGPGPIG